MKCRICGESMNELFVKKVLRKYDVKYYKCEGCGYICTENPHWLEEAYNNPMNISDTGILVRNDIFVRYTTLIIKLLLSGSQKYIDYAGGYGVFTRLMRDRGFDFYWDDKYTKNIFARGFEHQPATETAYDLVTAFEVFEHFIDPVAEFNEIIKFSDTILFSTELHNDEMRIPEWRYLDPEHGQHISFYSKKTLKQLGAEYKLNFYSFGVVHLFTAKKISALQIFLIKVLVKLHLDKLALLNMEPLTYKDHTELLQKH